MSAADSELELSVAPDQVRAALEATDGVARAHLRRALSVAARDLAGLARSLAPRGQTGKLEASLKPQLIETGNTMTARVGPAIFYGGILEHGVREKLVTVHAAATAGLVKKATYQRRFALEAHPFAAPAMAALRTPIEASVAAALEASAAEINNGD